MDTKQLLEMLKKDLTKWTPEQLRIAYNYSLDMCIDLDQKSIQYAWWWNLNKAIELELESRGQNNDDC